MRVITDTNLQCATRIINTDYLIIGPVPNEEQCTDAGKDPDLEKLECRIYSEQLLRVYGIVPEPGFLFILKNTGHDFGIYYEVAIMYVRSEEEESASETYALKIESGCENWDEISLQRLIEEKHPLHYKEPGKIIQFKKAI